MELQKILIYQRLQKSLLPTDINLQLQSDKGLISFSCAKESWQSSLCEYSENFWLVQNFILLPRLSIFSNSKQRKKRAQFYHIVNLVAVTKFLRCFFFCRQFLEIELFRKFPSNFSRLCRQHSTSQKSFALPWHIKTHKTFFNKNWLLREFF